VIRDITEQVETEHRLKTQNWALSAYAGASLALGQASSSEHIPQAICEAITRQSVYLLAWVGIAEDSPDKRIKVAAAAGSSVGYFDGLKLSWAEDGPEGLGPIGMSIRTSELQIVEDSETAGVFRPWSERALRFGIRSSVFIPFSMKGGQRGALIVCAALPNAFEPVAIDAFNNLAQQIRHGIHTLDQEQVLQTEREQMETVQIRLSEAMSAMVVPIVTAMEMRDPYTAGHQARVAELAYAIGKEMGWPEIRLQGLRAAGLVHDIGKISIPAEILTKPTRLTSAERELINAHVESGYTILKGIPFAWPIADIVRQHHEKLDGSGYPRGLKANEILDEAKVLTVADMVEAMAAHRPYRPGIPLHIALELIEKEAGTLLDAEIVRVCVSLFREKGFLLPGLNSTDVLLQGSFH
jgi:putative nucleotidyltransferase with HDIG domain